MKSPNDCLEAIQNGEHGKYPYTETMLEHIDADKVEQMIAAICKACDTGNSADVRIFGSSFGNNINRAMYERALKLSEGPSSHSFESNEADVRREE
jgi:hypothetical protein